MPIDIKRDEEIEEERGRVELLADWNVCCRLKRTKGSMEEEVGMGNGDEPGEEGGEAVVDGDEEEGSDIDGGVREELGEGDGEEGGEETVEA